MPNMTAMAAWHIKKVSGKYEETRVNNAYSRLNVILQNQGGDYQPGQWR